MNRLSAPPLPPSVAGLQEVPTALADVSHPLLCVGVTKMSRQFSDAARSQPDRLLELKRFLEQPNVHRSGTWKQLFGSLPPRGTVARLARLTGATLHDSVGFYNHTSPHTFKQEVRRLVRWYAPGRRVHRVRTGILRNRTGGVTVSGRRSAITRKVRAHFRRLRKPLRVEGLFNWARVAIATRAAGVPVHSGTVSVERCWSSLESMLPGAVRTVSVRWFNVLASLMFLRYNFRHFSGDRMPGIAERDSLLAQRLDVLQMLSEAAACPEGDHLRHLEPLFGTFRL
jgi:hypothetical protein